MRGGFAGRLGANGWRLLSNLQYLGVMKDTWGKGGLRPPIVSVECAVSSLPRWNGYRGCSSGMVGHSSHRLTGLSPLSVTGDSSFPPVSFDGVASRSSKYGEFDERPHMVV
jgi:hypothetical protein